MHAEPFEANVLSCEALAPRVRRIVLERSDGRPMTFQPGQWLNVFVPTPLREIRRAYSIASAPDESPRFELAVTEVEGGPGSGYLCTLTAGSSLRCVGPHGVFTRSPENPAPALFVGTGTGVTPLRSMLLAALAADSTAPLWLLLGTRHEEGLLYRAELERIAQQHANVRAFFTLSQPPSTWTGFRGYVQDHVSTLWNELASRRYGDPHLFVCGLERMVSIVRNLARNEMKLPRDHVHSERYD